MAGASPAVLAPAHGSGVLIPGPDERTAFRDGHCWSGRLRVLCEHVRCVHMEWRIENERSQTDSARPNAPHNFRALAGKAKDKRMKLSTPHKVGEVLATPDEANVRVAHIDILASCQLLTLCGRLHRRGRRRAGTAPLAGPGRSSGGASRRPALLPTASHIAPTSRPPARPPTHPPTHSLPLKEEKD